MHVAKGLNKEPQNLSHEFDLNETLQKLNPVLRTQQRKGWVFAILIVICVIGLTMFAPLVIDLGDPWCFIVPIAIGACGLIELNKWLIRSQQKVVLPYLAEAIELEYKQDADLYPKRFPRRLLPHATSCIAEDCFSGTLAGRQITIAEVKIATGHNNSQSLFEGIVLRFRTATMLPSFYIADKEHVGGFFRRINVDDLTETDTLESKKGTKYGVWLSDTGIAQKNPALRAVLDILINLENQIGVDARLFSVTSNGEEIHVALSCKRGLFQIGGLFASQSNITDSITRAFDRLKIPLEITSQLLEAERKSAQLNQS